MLPSSGADTLSTTSTLIPQHSTTATASTDSALQPLAGLEPMRPAAAIYHHFCFDGSWGPLSDLHTAAMLGNVADVERLSSSGGSCQLDAPDAHGCTALHHAALSTCVECVLLPSSFDSASNSGVPWYAFSRAWNARVARSPWPVSLSGWIFSESFLKARFIAASSLSGVMFTPESERSA